MTVPKNLAISIQEDPGNLVDGDGLQEKSGETMLDKIFLRLDVSGNGINGKIGELPVRTDFGDKFLSVHFGHPYIGQDDVKRLFRRLNLVPCFSAIDSLHDIADSDLGEKRLQNREVQRDIIRDQDINTFFVLDPDSASDFAWLPETFLPAASRFIPRRINSCPEAIFF